MCLKLFRERQRITPPGLSEGALKKDCKARFKGQISTIFDGLSASVIKEKGGSWGFQKSQIKRRKERLERTGTSLAKGGKGVKKTPIKKSGEREVEKGAESLIRFVAYKLGVSNGPNKPSFWLFAFQHHFYDLFSSSNFQICLTFNWVGKSFSHFDVSDLWRSWMGEKTKFFDLTGKLLNHFPDHWTKSLFLPLAFLMAFLGVGSDSRYNVAHTQ